MFVGEKTHHHKKTNLHNVSVKRLSNSNKAKQGSTFLKHILKCQEPGMAKTILKVKYYRAVKQIDMDKSPKYCRRETYSIIQFMSILKHSLQKA